MSALAVRIKMPRGVKALLLAVSFAKEMLVENVRAAMGAPPPAPFSFNERDVVGEPPGVATWGPGRWSKGGDA